MLQSGASSCCINTWSWIFFITVITAIDVAGFISAILNLSIDFFLSFIIINFFIMLSVSARCVYSLGWISLRLRSFFMFFLSMIFLWLIWKVILLIELTFRIFLKRLLWFLSFISCRYYRFSFYFFLLLKVFEPWSSLISSWSIWYFRDNKTFVKVFFLWDSLLTFLCTFLLNFRIELFQNFFITI